VASLGASSLPWLVASWACLDACDICACGHLGKELNWPRGLASVSLGFVCLPELRSGGCVSQTTIRLVATSGSSKIGNNFKHKHCQGGAFLLFILTFIVILWPSMTTIGGGACKFHPNFPHISLPFPNFLSSFSLALLRLSSDSFQTLFRLFPLAGLGLFCCPNRLESHSLGALRSTVLHPNDFTPSTSNSPTHSATNLPLISATFTSTQKGPHRDCAM